MMRVLLAVVCVVALTNLLVSVSAAGAVGDHCCDNMNWCFTEQPCNAGLTCCFERPLWMGDIGGSCIDPAVSTCASCPVYSPTHPQNRVCPNSSPICCGDCIDTTKQCCHHYLSTDSFQCGADQTCCGFSNNSTHACCDTSQACVNDVCVPKVTPAPGCVIAGDLKCGDRCYSPTTHVCANPSTSFLCPVAFPLLCGSNACYSSTQYECSNGQLVPISTGGTQGPTSGGGATQTPTAAPGCVMPGDMKCGDRCYSPVTHVCANASTSFLCPVTFPSLCGSDACYSTSQYTCVNGKLQPK